MAHLEEYYKKGGGIIYHLVDRKNGVDTSLKGLGKEQAEKYLKAYEGRLLLGDMGIIDEDKRYDEFRDEVLDFYKNVDPVQKEKNSTYIKYKYAFKKFDGCHNAIKLCQIKVRDVQNWLVAMRGKNLSDTTISIDYRCLKHAFKLAIDHKYLVENPFKKVKVTTPRNRKEKRPLTDEEVDRLLLAAQASECQDAELMVLLFVGCGLRRQELTHLRWKDVDFQNKKISVQSWGKREWETKTKEFRRIPIPPEAIRHLVLQKSRAQGELVFPSPMTGGVRDKGAMVKLFSGNRKIYRNGLFKNAGIMWAKGVHVLRHTFGFRMGKITDIKTLAVMMGHASTKTTEIYMHTTEERTEEAMSKAPRMATSLDKQQDVINFEVQQ